MSVFGVCNKVPENYILCVINSTLISYYVDTFINNTQTFQINDARQLPIIVPTVEQLSFCDTLAKDAIAQKLKGEIPQSVQEKLDDNSTYLKARIKANGVFDVLSMSLFTMTNLPDWYYVALINSEFISLYVDNFINNTSHFQINDARQLPIIIPQKEAFESLQKIVADCISLKRTAVIDEILMEEKQYDLDRLVRSFYGVEDFY